MAQTRTPRSADVDESAALDRNFEIRRVLGSAYGFVQGQEAAERFGAVTYEELADAQIERIEGQGTLARPNEFDRLDRLERELLDVIAQLRATPPEHFVNSDPSRDVNTPRESSGD